VVSSSIILKNQTILSINQFLNLYNEINRPDLEHILRLDFNLDYSVLERYFKSQRICPVIELARLKDAEEISNIFKDIYQGTYPYKRMENRDSIAEMIKDPNYYWFLFKLDSGEVIGAFGSHLELEEKRGFLYGFVIKKGYHKIIDVFKAFIGCAMFLWKKYQQQILLWYGEMRTNETSSQFFTSIVGMKPVAFYPNKDLFFNKEESDILQVIYDKEVLTTLRRKEQPKIIRQALNSYSYVNKRFKLGLPLIVNPKVNINKKKISNIEDRIEIITEEEEYGNKWITILNKNSRSFIKFLYNPYSKNFEKTQYQVECLEELHVFLKKVNYLIKDMKLNYFECFVSAYNAEHQKIFDSFGFKPRGYVPSWIYNVNENVFEDRIVFNYFRDELDKNMRIIPEVDELLETLNIYKEDSLPKIEKNQ
jgi:hypothetical protein